MILSADWACVSVLCVSFDTERKVEVDYFLQIFHVLEVAMQKLLAKEERRPLPDFSIEKKKNSSLAITFHSVRLHDTQESRIIGLA